MLQCFRAILMFHCFVSKAKLIDFKRTADIFAPIAKVSPMMDARPSFKTLQEKQAMVTLQGMAEHSFSIVLNYQHFTCRGFYLSGLPLFPYPPLSIPPLHPSTR